MPSALGVEELAVLVVIKEGRGLPYVVCGALFFSVVSDNHEVVGEGGGPTLARVTPRTASTCCRASRLSWESSERPLTMAALPLWP